MGRTVRRDFGNLSSFLSTVPELLRDWSFPLILLAAWMLATAYTLVVIGGAASFPQRVPVHPDKIIAAAIRAAPPTTRVLPDAAPHAVGEVCSGTGC